MRKLFYVPILHSPADLGSIQCEVAGKGIGLIGKERWKKHLETIDLFWDSVENYFRSMKKAGELKIFQDTLAAEGEIAGRIVNEATEKGSRNYAIIKELVARGAKIMKTEDLSLVKREAALISRLARSKNLIEKLIAYLQYKLSKGKLLRERDKFIAKTVNESLKEGEMGVLFLGAFHDVFSELTEGIEVIELKEKEMIAEYQRIYYLKSKEKDANELSAYLALPIQESDLK